MSSSPVKVKNSDRLVGWNEYSCKNCFFRFKSHYEQHACPYCKSKNIEFECYSVGIMLKN